MCIQIVINTYNTPEITREYRESFILLDHIRETVPFSIFFPLDRAKRNKMALKDNSSTVFSY